METYAVEMDPITDVIPPSFTECTRGQTVVAVVNRGIHGDSLTNTEAANIFPNLRDGTA